MAQYWNHHHDAQLDASGGWPTALQSWRSPLINDFRIGHSQTGHAWYKGNRPRFHNFIPVNIGFAIHKSSTFLTGTQGPYDYTQQRGASLIAGLQAQAKKLYGG